MNALQTVSIAGGREAPSGSPRPQRRRREELEALAAEFVNSKLHPLPPPPRAEVPKAALAAGGAVLLAVVAWLPWPSGGSAPVREQAPAVNEAEVWAGRLEAERERTRQELQRSREFLARMAAADHALLEDLTARAQNLAIRPETAPVAASQVEREPEPSPPAAATPVQAKADAKEVQVAAASKCNIRVSELSGSGKLTYADVARMKGARTDSAGHVFTPPVRTANGRDVVFEVTPDGCVRVVR